MDTLVDIVPFSNAEFGELRAFNIDGEPWFVAKDVCDALGIATNHVKDGLDSDEVCNLPITEIGPKQGGKAPLIVSEPGFYKLVMKSRKPEAKAFQRWVTHEVLPSIRGNGGYLTPQKVEEVLTDPDTIIRLATELKNERSRSRALEESVSVLADENERMLPAARQAEAFLDSRGDYTVTQAAGLLSQVDRAMTRKRLFTMLRADEMVETRSNRATARAVERGYLRNVAASYLDRDGERRLRDPYAVVTPKGLDWMARRYCPAPSQPSLALDCGVM